MGEALSKLGAALTPPGISPDLAWKLAVSAASFASVTVLAVHLWYAAANFAMAADVRDLARLELEEKLDEVYTIICTRDAVDAAIADRARTLQRMYRDVNDDQQYQPDCDLLMKLAAARRQANQGEDDA